MILDKKIAILTGATGGFGRAITSALIRNGVMVYGVGRNIDTLKKIKGEEGENFHPAQLDITDEAKVDQWIKDNFSATHCPDILINNAGVGSFHKIDETTTDTWLEMVNTNLNGMFYITSRVAALMKQKETSSHIINIGSILGKIGRVKSAAYCTTKFGVHGFSAALLLELRQYNIKVTCFSSGSIETGFFKTSGIEPHENMLHPSDLANSIIHILQTPDNMLIDEIVVRPLNPKAPEHHA